jgi:hypothetical protein
MLGIMFVERVSVKRYVEEECHPQSAIETNREVLISALLAGVVRSFPARRRKFLPDQPQELEIERMLQSELTSAFGRAEDMFQEMKVRVVFKGVTYESLSDPEFMRVAREKFRHWMLFTTSLTPPDVKRRRKKPALIDSPVLRWAMDLPRNNGSRGFIVSWGDHVTTKSGSQPTDPNWRKQAIALNRHRRINECNGDVTPAMFKKPRNSKTFIDLPFFPK